MKFEFIDSIKYNLKRKRLKSDRRYIFRTRLIKYLPAALIFVLDLNLIIKLILAVLWVVFATVFFDHRDLVLFDPIIRVWFGVPGSGKTSVGAWISKQSIKHHYKVLSNVEIKGTYKLEENDLGNYDMSFDGEGCQVIYDEATANGLDNRNFIQFAKSEKPRYFSLHRHMNNRVDVFSQDYDVDLKIKGRAGDKGLFHLTRSPIKGFVIYRMIKKVFFIKKDDKQFVDGFQYRGLPRICYTRSVWDSFDTLDMSMCPKEQKNWELW